MILIPKQYITIVIPEQLIEFEIVKEEQIKGLRVQATAGINQNELESQFDKFIEARVNTLYYTITYNKEAYYHSTLMNARNFDALKRLSELCSSNNIDLYALVPTAHLGWNNPEWNARNNYSAVTQDWLDFTVPNARQYITDVCNEIVTNYDVKGVLLDYIRWHDTWADAAGLSHEPISETVAMVHNAISSNATIACSPWAEFQYARNHAGQDTKLWLDEGWVDYATPMAYPPKGITNRHSYWVGLWKETGHWPDRIIPRLAMVWFSPTERKPVDFLIQEIASYYELGATGMTLWDNRYLVSNQQLIDALREDGW